MNRFYFIPIIRIQPGNTVYRIPKYFPFRPSIEDFYEGEPLLENTARSMWDFGEQDLYFMRCKDITQEQHDLLASKPDVLALPEDIDQNFTPAATIAAQTYLENYNVPLEWLNTSYTYRQAIRLIGGMFMFAQRFRGFDPLADGRLFPPGITLETKFINLPVAVRNKLKDVAVTIDMDISGLSPQSTIRQILKEVADQWGSRKLVIGGQEI